jgi:type II restriction enzyme
MGLSNEKREQVSTLLRQKTREKLENYSPESGNMPFHVRLLGKDKLALFSFIQSVNTTLGTSVFEQIAEIIAKTRFSYVKRQYKDLEGRISEKAESRIQDIINGLAKTTLVPNKPCEIDKILEVAQEPPFKEVKRPTIDLFLKSSDGSEYYFDIKTAKPNAGEIKGYKRTLLEWVAMRGVECPPPKIYTGLAMPYNPYEPQPYTRWTVPRFLDKDNELMVGAAFWDFLGGENTYSELLEIFENVGVELREEIDSKFRSFRPNQ